MFSQKRFRKSRDKVYASCTYKISNRRNTPFLQAQHASLNTRSIVRYITIHPRARLPNNFLSYRLRLSASGRCRRLTCSRSHDSARSADRKKLRVRSVDCRNLSFTPPPHPPAPHATKLPNANGGRTKQNFGKSENTSRRIMLNFPKNIFASYCILEDR